LHLLRRVHRPEPQNGSLADEPDELVLLHVRHGDDDLVVTGCGYLGLADAQAVHTTLNDGLGQLQTVGIHCPATGGVLRRQGDGGTAPQVQTELRKPCPADRHEGD
jgi:hypothetical protein